MRRLLWVLPALLLAGCGSESGAGGDGVRVVATTTQLADFVARVGGERVEVEGILPADADPHDYEPRPSDAASLAEADVVFRSGGEVDEWLDGLLESAGGDAAQVTLIDSVETIPGDGEADPHWWQDPRNAARAVEAIRSALADADPGGRGAYARRASGYTRALRRLDADIERCMGRIPPAQRKLVTTHDALGYLAERYGIEVIGSVIPSLSTQAQPSAKDVADLVDQIEAEGVKAVFPEATVSQDLERAISREAGVEVGGELWTDSLGPEGSGADTYVGAMRANASSLARGMSGGGVSC